MKAIKSAGVSDDEVRVLLDRYKCPVPFHQIRTRFLGNIASPVMSASPIETVRGLWGGELPPFDDINAANELIGGIGDGAVEQTHTSSRAQCTISAATF
jgi:hypothetical protein